MRHIITNNDIQILQQDINTLLNWSIDWGLKFNSDKCMVLSAKRSHSVDNMDPPTYTMADKLLHTTKDIQDLGVTVDDGLTWTNHIYKMVRKAHSRSWLCMRAIGFHACYRAKKSCYITMVISILEYASPIWSPTFKYLIIAVERIQRRATNYIPNNPK